MTITEGSLYGERLYGDSYYGSPLGGLSTLPTYSVAPMTATVPTAAGTNPYTQVQISWAVPNSGYQLRLLRNSFSVPADQKDGVTLTQVPFNWSSGYVDTLATTNGGMWLYYSLFMLTGPNGGYWQRAGDVQYMLPNNWGYGARMFALLPQYYQSMDYAIDDPIYLPAQDPPVTWGSLDSMTWSGL